MKGYKGFNKGLVCLGKQYAENTVFEEEEAVICNRGMHFCENPFDVLDHYGLLDDNGNFNDFAEVEALAEAKTDDNEKYCTTKLKVGAKLSFAGFVKACVDFTLEKTKPGKGRRATNDKGGNSAQIGSSGNYAKIGSSGYSAQIGSSGDYAQIGSSGNSAKIGSSGNSAQIDSTGKNAVVMCTGEGSIAKAKIGSWITLAEWKWINNEYTPVCVKTEKVDGERIKEDTYYKLKDGEFVEIRKRG